MRTRVQALHGLPQPFRIDLDLRLGAVKKRQPLSVEGELRANDFYAFQPDLRRFGAAIDHGFEL